MKDYYAILGIAPGASKEEITKAFRKKAREFHPDMHPAEKQAEAAEKFKEVNQAYEALTGEGDPQPQGFNFKGSPFKKGAPFTSAMDDFFGQFFGEHTNAQNGEPIVLRETVTLEEVRTGVNRTIAYMQNVICDSCKGIGGVVGSCPECHGSGVRVIRGANMTVRAQCQVCEGSGEKIEVACPDCSGSGFAAPVEKKVDFKIPVGVEDGMRFTFRGAGQPSAAGRNGDMHVVVNVAKHPWFSRIPEGGIFISVPVSYTQLVLGDSVEVPTLEGLATVKIPPGSQSGTKLRLRGKGLPKFNNEKTTYAGDQIVELKLEVPTALDDKQKAILEELALLERENITPLRKSHAKTVGEINGRPKE